MNSFEESVAFLQAELAGEEDYLNELQIELDYRSSWVEGAIVESKEKIAQIRRRLEEMEVPYHA